MDNVYLNDIVNEILDEISFAKINLVFLKK